MDNSQLHRNRVRKTRAMRVRQRLRGNEEKPRLTVYKSSKHLYVQLIDDEKGATLASTSTLSKEFSKTEFNRKNKDSGKKLGLKIAELAKGKNVQSVIFDRGRFKYHGVIASIADGAREVDLRNKRPFASLQSSRSPISSLSQLSIGPPPLCLGC